MFLKYPPILPLNKFEKPSFRLPKLSFAKVGTVSIAVFKAILATIAYKEAVAARSTDKRIQEVAQDGGIASALLIYALENNIIEGAVVAGDPGDDWVPIPEIATTADEILSAAGTKYSMSPNVWGIKEAARQHGIESIGTVVTPCQMQGILRL